MASSVQQQIAEILKQYENECNETVRKVTQEVAKETVTTLKQTSPKRKGRGKHYANGWDVKEETTLGGGISFMVYNKTKPQLTHLLEHGHAKVGGGRVQAIPHIAPAEEKAEIELLRRLEEKL